MKGIIVEIHPPYAALLSEDGDIIKVANDDYIIGQEVVINMKTKGNFRRIMAIATTAAMLVMVLGISSLAYFTPYAYVSMDVNPSIEFVLNRFDRVLEINGVNEDGEAILKSMELTQTKLKNKSIDSALELTIQTVAQAGYFEGDESAVVIATASEDPVSAQDLAVELEEVTTKALAKNNWKVEIDSEVVATERVQEAKELGVTPGKLNIVDELIAASGNEEAGNRENWLDSSVKDIMAETKMYKEKYIDEDKNAGDDTQNKEQEANEAQNGVGPENGNSDSKGSSQSNNANDTTNATDSSTPGKGSKPEDTGNNETPGDGDPSGAGTGSKLQAGTDNSEDTDAVDETNGNPDGPADGTQDGVLDGSGAELDNGNPDGLSDGSHTGLEDGSGADDAPGNGATGDTDSGNPDGPADGLGTGVEDGSGADDAPGNGSTDGTGDGTGSRR